MFAYCEPLQITGTYSNLRFERPPDALLGAEVRLVGADCGRLQATVQFTNGEVGVDSEPSPLLLGTVTLESDQIPLRTPYPEPCFPEDAAFLRVELPGGSGYAGTLFGVIFRDRLEVVVYFANGREAKWVLERSPGFWER